MDENLAIPRDTLNALRSLTNADLVKLIIEISDYGWAKAEPTLRLMMKEKGNVR